MDRSDHWLNRKFGTERGWVRYALSVLEHYSGTSKTFQNPDLLKVERIVFVCLGNICRSAYAHQYAAKVLQCDVASFGLSTTSNMPCDATAHKVAGARGIDMSGHKTTDLQDFDFRPGDLLLTMELRQARRLQPVLIDKTDVQVTLLGNWHKPIHPHIHDPHTLSEAYFDSCFAVIEHSIDRIKLDLAAAGNPARVNTGG